MESVADEVDCGDLSVGYLDRFGVLLFIQLGAHPEAGFGGRSGDQLNNRSIAASRLSAPIDRDERKETMLNFVPLASSRREMANGNREFELVGPASQPRLRCRCAARRRAYLSCER